MDYDIRDAGPGPIVSALCRELGVLETINRTVEWDEKQCNLDPGTHTLAMIINILCGRTPLYRVERFYAEQDIELLFGGGIDSSDFNDDALSRTLDKIYAAGPKKIFSAVALQALMKEEIVLSTLHADTTSRLVYGAYLQEEGLNIARGYNKEHRSDLKQFRVGLVTTDEGYPFLGEILNGNLDDKTWNKQLLENLPEHFTAEKLKELTYVADSAVVTKTNLGLMDELKLNFITRLPARFDLVETLIKKAFSEDNWAEVGTLSPGKNKASYRLQEYTEDLFERTYRFVVVHSSQLDKRKLKGLEARVAKEKEELV
jgi:transposase